ncbi:MAG: IS21 family transposase [Planctomycetota bacterium]
MANQLTMADIQAILTLHKRGWRNRRIARELNIDRETVAKYIRASACVPKPATAPIGSAITGEGVTEGPERLLVTLDSNEERGIVVSPASFLTEVAAGDSKPAKAPIGSEPSEPAEAPIGSETFLDPDLTQAFLGVAGPDHILAGSISSEKECGRSACEPYRQVILEKLEQGLSAQRIYQDLVGDGFDHEYHSVRRFVAKLQRTSPLPFRRMESASGEEAQIDFGTGAWIELPDGKRRRSHVFRIVLSYSRKGYCEAVYRQTTEDFIRCIENAFWHFAGVPKILVIDNLKAGVKQPDWYDPELNPKIQSFCEYYGCVIMPTKPRTSRHKGKIESGVNYVQENGLKGHGFTSLEKENEHLLDWETTVADTRIHGTIHKQVGKLFQEVERSTLQRLPVERFPFFHEGKRIVHRDGHVEVAKSYYSVAPEYRGHTLWVRWDLRLVRIFNNRMEQMTLHSRKEPGQFSTLPEHIHNQKRSRVELGAVALLSRARSVGEHTAR